MDDEQGKEDLALKKYTALQSYIPFLEEHVPKLLENANKNKANGELQSKYEKSKKLLSLLKGGFG